jgi:hypothetical protein
VTCSNFYAASLGRMKGLSLVAIVVLFLVLVVQRRMRDGFATQVGARCIYDSQCNPMRFCRDTGDRDPDTDIYIHRCSKNSGFLQNALDYVPDLADFETKALN